MNVKRFTARSSREAMALVRQAFGDDAVVLSNKPCPEGVEVLAMAPEGMSQIERVAASTPRSAPAAMPRQQPAAQPAMQRQDAQPRQALKQRLATAPALQRAEPGFGGSVGDDVNAMAMSTLSFQDYVRERMLKRRAAEMNGQPDPMMDEPVAPAYSQAQMNESVASMAAQREQRARSAMQTLGARRVDERAYEPAPQPAPAPRVVPPVLRDEIRVQQPVQDLGGIAAGYAGMGGHPLNDMPSSRREQEMMSELRAMKGMIEERFGALAFMEKLQRQPAQARLTQKLLDAGLLTAPVRVPRT